MANQRSSRPKSGQPKQSKKKGAQSAPWIDDLIKRIAACPDAESLNQNVITPFIQALVTECDARGYVFNIYGDHCNLAITPEDHAESVYRLINAYLDEADL